jgi:hypothetical protein
MEQRVNRIDLLKIDTEGFEINVLKGGHQMLSTGNVAAILCEVALSKKNPRNTQLHDLIDHLEPLGYFFVGLYDTNINHFREGLAYSNALFVRK